MRVGWDMEWNGLDAHRRGWRLLHIWRPKEGALSVVCSWFPAGAPQFPCPHTRSRALALAVGGGVCPIGTLPDIAI